MIEIILMIKYAAWDHWKETCICLLLNILGSLMPVWLTAFLLFLFNQWQGLFPLLEHGELAIYSAAFLSSSIYLMFKASKQNKGSIIFTFFFLILSAIAFTGVKCRELLISISELNRLFLFYSTGILFFYSILTFFVANFRENVRTDSTVINKINKEKLKNLNTKFDNL